VSDEVTLHVTDDPTSEQAGAVWRELEAFNRRFVSEDRRPLAVFLRDEDGQLHGGLVGSTLWGWLHIELLWVEEALRGQGWGGRLLTAAEGEAVTRGCRNAFLTTMSFQAPEFYRRHGYEVIARMDGFPPGHSLLTLTKELMSGPTDGQSG
jgi:ribosomal protein S18 acetylase RimI-like enzyme